jgi:hypothetical protein
VHGRENALAVAVAHPFADLQKNIFVYGSQQGKQVADAYRMFCGSQQAGLIEKTQGIAQASAGTSGN